MTPKQKALDLYDQFLDLAACQYESGRGYSLSSLKENAKKCALIVANEVIENDSQFYYGNYWQQVKQEIENL